MKALIKIAFAVAALCGVAVAPCHAQATRTWVSGVGDDANPCSRTAPCKTFAGAISKTAAKGEISVLDPGGFGAVTITKSLSIVAAGAEGGVLVSGAAGITINAGASDTVMLKGLQIEGAGTGTSGISVVQAQSVFVIDSVIHGFQAGGTGTGVSVKSGTSTSVFLKNVRINGNSIGVTIASAGSQNLVTLDGSTVVGNPTSISADSGSGPSVLAATGSTIFGPATLANGAQFVSSGNNAINGNLTPTSTVMLK